MAVEDAGTDAEGEEDEGFEAAAAAVDGPCAGEEEDGEEELGGCADLAVVVERGDPDTVGVVGGPADFCGGGIRGGPAFSEEPFLVIGETAEDDPVEPDAAGVAAVDPAFEALLGEPFEVGVWRLGGEETGGGVGAGLFGAPCEGGGDRVEGGGGGEGDEERDPRAAGAAGEGEDAEAAGGGEGGAAALAAAHGEGEDGEADGPAETSAWGGGAGEAGACPDGCEAPCDSGGDWVLAAVDEPIAEPFAEVGGSVDAPEDDEADDCGDEGHADADTAECFEPLVVGGGGADGDDEDEEPEDVAEGAEEVVWRGEVAGGGGEAEEREEEAGGGEGDPAGTELAEGVVAAEPERRQEEGPEPDFLDDACGEEPPAGDEPCEGSVAEGEPAAAAAGGRR